MGNVSEDIELIEKKDLGNNKNADKIKYSNKQKAVLLNFKKEGMNAMPV